MTTHDVGDRPRLTYTFTEGNPAVAADPAKVVFTMTPGIGAASSTSYTWLGVGGGDAELVRDSLGVFHVDWAIVKYGAHTIGWESFDSDDVSLDGAGDFFFAS